MEMYQEPPPVENPLEEPNSPMEDMLPLEPKPVTHYEPDIPRGHMHTLTPQESPIEPWQAYLSHNNSPESCKCSASPTSPLSHPYANIPVGKAATNQSCLLPCHLLTAPCPRVRATSRPLQKSLQIIPQPHRALQKMWIATWPLIGSPSNLTTIKGSCLL